MPSDFDFSQLPRIPYVGWRYENQILASGQMGVRVVDIWNTTIWCYDGTDKTAMCQFKGDHPFHPNELVWFAELTSLVFKILNPGVLPKTPKAEGPTLWESLDE